MTTESKTGHTPGPWSLGSMEYSREGLAIVGTVPHIHMSGPCAAVVVAMGAQEQEVSATARLIAAAPALLAALERVVFESEKLNRPSPGIRDARSAIAAARGECTQLTT